MKKVINNVIAWLLIVIMPSTLSLLVMITLGQLHRGNTEIAENLLRAGSAIGIIIIMLWFVQILVIGPVVKKKKGKNENEDKD